MRFIRRALPYVLLALLLAAGTAFWLKHEYILDWAAMRGYEPAPVVEQLAEETAMTPYAKQLFYANRPVVEGKEAFNQHCTDPSEEVAVLGCFTGNRSGIYIYDVTDDRLAGIEHVTAAHEMLHQAYQRLDEQNRKRVNDMLQNFHDSQASEKLKDKLDNYRKNHDYELQNEMHSIFGTEAENLPDELEEHYKRYFTDRRKVLALHKKYQSEFDKRIAQIKAYDEELETLKAQIEANKRDLDAREQELVQRREQMDAYLEQNQIGQYNAAVPGFNSLVVDYRNLVNSTNTMVNEFNDVLKVRNELAVQERELEAAINSRVDTVPSQ